jgi:hypothetical protein
MSNVVICISTTHVSEFTQIISGRLYLDDDPIVRAHPDLFDHNLAKYAVGYVEPSPIVDRVDEPRRGPGRPRKEPADA